MDALNMIMITRTIKCYRIPANLLDCTHPLTRRFYDWRTRSDTIFALATSIQPVKGSPLGVIRVSGTKTRQVLCDFVERQPSASQQGHQKSGLATIKPRHATLTKIVDPRDNELLDMGLVLWFPKPHSYTGEDSCELHLHGSRAIINRVMSILGDIDGCRPAEPGEFTRRAVVNGKLNLIQAESLPELISAQTDQQRKLALNGLVGSTRHIYDKWTQILIRILAHLEASIDFGEDELIGEHNVVIECTQQIIELTKDITNFIAITSRCRDVARSGVRVSIIGPPNAGKSSLMNILCRHEKSIVSDLSGTTRDVIEHIFDLGGHTVEICDTAGLRDLDDKLEDLNAPDAKQTVIEQHDSIEREGIKRALNAAKEAHLIIYLVDSSQLDHIGATQTVQKIRQVLTSIDPERKKVIHVAVNKMDIASSTVTIDKLTQQLKKELGHNSFRLTSVSCRTNENIATLVESIAQSLNDLQACELEKTSVDKHAMDYVNERHLALLRSTARHLKRAQTLDIKTIDEMAQHVRESVDYLSRIVGTIDSEDVFDVIFRDFCIGK